MTDFHEGQLTSARSALSTLAHRGPDGWGDWNDERVYLGHRRLSIIDLSDRGRQPMVTATDRPVALTANGEIYNFRELRDELRSTCSFTSDSDSEVLLHGYIAWGIDGLLQRIEGLFAFAIYDSNLGKVFLCRDRVGIKPLFFGVFDQQVVWASELKAIVDFRGEHTLAVDQTAVYDYFNYGYVPCPKSLYKNIEKLEPATYLAIDVATGKVQTTKYWSLDATFNDTLANPSTVVRELVGSAVTQQMVSDAPLGVFLSGGVDSSIVASEAKKSNEDLITFGAYFGADENQDRRFSNMVAESLSTTHHVEHIPSVSAFESLPLLRTYLDEPFADFSFFPTLKISQIAARHVKVALSGDGGDEVFGGYAWYWNDRVTRRRHGQFQRAAELIAVAPTFGRRSITSARYRLHNLMLDQLTLYARLLGGPDEAAKRKYRALLEIPADYDDLWHFRRFYRPDLPDVTRFQYLDFHTFLPDDVLTKVDRASMAVSLEVRVPLLDRAVIETAFSLSESIKFQPFGAKSLLREAFADSIPAAVFKRPKIGFGVPKSSWSKQNDRKPLSARELVLKYAFPGLGVVS